MEPTARFDSEALGPGSPASHEEEILPQPLLLTLEGYLALTPPNKIDAMAGGSLAPAVPEDS